MILIRSLLDQFRDVAQAYEKIEIACESEEFQPVDRWRAAADPAKILHLSECGMPLAKLL